MSDWTACYTAIWTAENLEIFATPVMSPRGTLYEVAHNLDTDQWIKIMPGSGSHYASSTKEEAESLMTEGTWLCYKTVNGKATSYKRTEDGSVEVQWTGSVMKIKKLDV